MANENLSGEHGMVNGVTCLMQWNVARNRPPVVINNSKLRGGKGRRGGIGSWNGGWSADGGVPLVMPGELFSFVGYTAPADGDEGSDGIRYTGQAVCSQVVLNWDWSTDAIVSHTVQFQGHLGLTDASGAALIDGSTDTPSNSNVCAVQYGTGPTTITHMTTASITMSCAVTTFVNSSTGTETGAKASKDIDWVGTIVEQKTDRTIAEKTQLKNLKMFINATEFWQFDHAHFSNYSNLNVNRVSKEVISRTMNIGMDGSDASSGALGQILKPDGSVFWPVALT